MPFVLWAAEELDRAERSDDPEDVWRTWYALQMIVVWAANISKMLWGSGGTAHHRRALRDSLQMPDDSVLRRSRLTR